MPNIIAFGNESVSSGGDAGSGIQIDLLWENPNLTSQEFFGEITIENIGNYDLIMVSHSGIASFNSGVKYELNNCMFPIDNEGDFNYFSLNAISVQAYTSSDSNTYMIAKRSGYIPTNYPNIPRGIYFNECDKVSIDTNGTTYTKSANTYCIPYRIYGIKGVTDLNSNT